MYNKWTNGDQDVNKEILGYGGAMIFLIVGSGICNRILCLRWDTTCTRGSKKPLVFFGLKGKYIIYAVAVIGAGVVAALILSKFGLLGFIIRFIGNRRRCLPHFKKQDKNGLYDKTKNFDQIFIFPKKLNNKRFLKDGKDKETGI